MPVRMTGMISGMDTESLIKSMVDAQRLKNKKTTDKSTLLEWKQDKWKELNTKLLKLYQEDLSKLRLQGSFGVKKVTTSNDALVTVTGGSGAPTGSAALEITQTATTQSVTSKKLGNGVTGKSTLKSLGGLGFEEGKEIILTNGTKQSSLIVTEKTTLDDFLAAAKSVGLNANYDATQQRIFISGKESGAQNSFSIQQYGGGTTAAQNELKSLVGFSSMNDADKKKVLTALKDLHDGDKKTAAEQVLKDYATAKIENTIDAKVKKEAATTVLAEITSKLLSEVAEETVDNEIDNRYSAVGGFENSEDFQKLKSALIKELSYDAENLTPEDEENLLQLAITRQKTEIKKEIIGKEYLYQVEFDKAYEEFVKNNPDMDEEAVKEAIKESVDEKVATYISSDFIRAFNKKVNEEYATEENQEKVQQYYASKYENEKNTAVDAMIPELNNSIGRISGVSNNYDALASLGLGNVTGIEGDVTGDVDTDEMRIMGAKDAQITYNNVALTSSSNTFNVNGLTITVKGKSAPGEIINLNVTNDKQADYDMIKTFVTNYNNILKEMNELFYAPSSRGYAPLSDEEKEVMSEKQIDKWEDKIKDSALRRDDSLGALLTGLNNAIMSSVEVDGKKYSLANFGIKTSSDYMERGLLHIDGDADDALVSTLTNKLMEALEKDPELVGKVISGISKNVYDAMGKSMKSIPNVRSAFTFYNDKTMSKQQEEYQKKIKELEKKLVVIENKYYKQFAAMESALSKLQSQTSALVGMLGMDQGRQ